MLPPAAEEELPLVTADARLVRALAGSPHVVVHLDDVELRRAVVRLSRWLAATLQNRLPAR